jgi:hypothetical protein
VTPAAGPTGAQPLDPAAGVTDGESRGPGEVRR